MGELPKIKLSQPPLPPRKMALHSPWHKVGEADPEDCSTVLIRAYYIDTKTGRFVHKFEVFLYLARFGGFALHEKINNHLGLTVTHWMSIPPIK